MSKRKPKILNLRGQTKILNFFCTQVPNEKSSQAGGDGVVSEENLDSDCEFIPTTPMRNVCTKRKGLDSSPDLIPPTPPVRQAQTGTRKKLGSKSMRSTNLCLSQGSALLDLESKDISSPERQIFQHVSPNKLKSKYFTKISNESPEIIKPSLELHKLNLRPLGENNRINVSPVSKHSLLPGEESKDKSNTNKVDIKPSNVVGASTLTNHKPNLHFSNGDCEFIPTTPVRNVCTKRKGLDSSPDLIPPTPPVKQAQTGTRKKVKLGSKSMGSTNLCLTQGSASIELENKDILSPEGQIFQSPHKQKAKCLKNNNEAPEIKKPTFFSLGIHKLNPTSLGENDRINVSKHSLLPGEESKDESNTNKVDIKPSNVVGVSTLHFSNTNKITESIVDGRNKEEECQLKSDHSESIHSGLGSEVDSDGNSLIQLPVQSEIQVSPARQSSDDCHTSIAPLCKLESDAILQHSKSQNIKLEDTSSVNTLVTPLKLEKTSPISVSCERRPEQLELDGPAPGVEVCSTSLVPVREPSVLSNINCHTELFNSPSFTHGNTGEEINTNNTSLVVQDCSNNTPVPNGTDYNNVECSESENLCSNVGESNSEDTTDIQPTSDAPVSSEVEQGDASELQSLDVGPSSMPPSESVELDRTTNSSALPPETEKEHKTEGTSLSDKCDADLAFLDGWDLGEIFSSADATTCHKVEELSLETWQRCQVVDATPNLNGHGMSIHVQALDSGASTHCLVQGVWAGSSIKVRDIVSLRAVRSPVGHAVPWIVDNSGGLMVQYPDTLVSGTAVVGSLFCQRRGVLSDWFRGLDGSSKVMSIGSLVHELLQKVLKCQLYTVAGIQSAVDELLHTKDAINMMFSCSMSTSETQKELLGFVPHIKRFVDTYVCGDGQKATDGNWCGSICAVQDIEESIWTPRLGIKGKVDVTVEVDVRRHKKVMPLELKTGRPSFSPEHRGQVILYTMMMADMGRDVDSGLLLYLRDGSLREVCVSHHERRDLVLLRNQLAHYLTLPPAQSEEPPCLPEPINHRSACQKCPYLTLCSTYLVRDGLEHLSPQHPLASLAPSATAHLSENHMNYLVHWGMLLRVEEAEHVSGSTLKDLWNMTPEHREKQGRSLAGLSLVGPVTELPGAGFKHVLHRKDSLRALSSSALSVGDWVLVSTGSRLGVASGTILDINGSSITLHLGRDVSVYTSDAHLHVDPYESLGMLSRLLTSLGCLMEDTNAAARLRRLVVDCECPKFEKLSSRVLQDGEAALKDLNPSQLRCVLQALSAQEYLLIKGMAGTGKTATIAALVQLLVLLGKTVLVTSHTNSAVDNMLLKLVERNVDFLRLGSSARLHHRLRDWSEEVLVQGCTSPELLAAAYQSKTVVGTTCLSANHILFTHRTFDVCIVDECTQVLQPAALLPLFHAKSFVLVGDPEQLPPVVKSKKASQLGLSESLFVRLDRPEAMVCLDLQYRMNRPVMDLANRLAYKGQLKCGSDAVANATLKLPLRTNMDKSEAWLVRILSDRLEDSVLFLDTGPAPLQKGVKVCSNPYEAAVVVRLLEAFSQAGLEGESVGVIAPYRAQVTLLKKLTAGVEVSTVDQYQGRDKALVIFSCTKSFSGMELEAKETEILMDKRRLTVAITRAKHKLLLIGDVATLRHYSPFHQVLECLAQEQTIPLVNNSNDFHWDTLLARTQPVGEK